jgi:hypothetical protein
MPPEKWINVARVKRSKDICVLATLFTMVEKFALACLLIWFKNIRNRKLYIASIAAIIYKERMGMGILRNLLVKKVAKLTPITAIHLNLISQYILSLRLLSLTFPTPECGLSK